MYYEKKRHNRPAITLIKEYCDKKSGKVSEARRELQRRFEWLDWSQQKKIMMAHLQACTSDRQWAYTHLLSFWDDSFIPIIDKLWQTYHEERCSWIIVNHFPEDYLKNHIEELSFGRNYYFICRRLGSNKQFQIEASRLRPLDHLALMANLGRSMNAETAMKQVFNIAKKECLSPHYFIMGRQWFEPRLTKPSPLHLRSLDRAFYYLQELPEHDAMNIFKTWCDRVSDDVVHSQNFKSLLLEPISDEAFNQKAYHLLLIYIAKNLPVEMQDIELLKMTKFNDALQQLVDIFDLEEDKMTTPPSFI